MIVKNESKVIERCLASVKPFIDYWVIVDTGSVDGTQEIIKKFMKDIPGELHECPWVNFEHNRNQALKFAKKKGDYLLFIDADEELRYEKNFTLPELDKDSYCFRLQHGLMTYMRVQLVDNRLDWNWKGVVHEAIKSPQAQSKGVLEGVTNFIRREGCRSQDPDSISKDAILLEEALVKEPYNSRYAFYLALSYYNCRKYEKSLEQFQKRVQMGGCEQEVYWSKYAIGMIQEFLNYDVDTVTKSFCDAYLFRPIRAEPLFRLAQMYRKEGNYYLGYVFSGLGLAHPLPKDEGMFVENWVYDFGLQAEFVLSTLQVKKYKECIDACNILLASSQILPSVKESIELSKQQALAKLAYLSEQSRSHEDGKSSFN